MHKVIIVDDDKLIREGIRDHIDWSSIDYDLAAVCENGKQAMDAVDRHKPDLLLTDIYMPFVDGMELTEYVVRKHKNTKVIMLTGYEDFEYAKQAIKHKVYEYVLKPVSAEELTEILVRARHELDQEKERQENWVRLGKQVQESLPLLKARFLNQWMGGGLHPNTVIQKLAYFNIQPFEHDVVALIVDLDDPKEIERTYPDTESVLLQYAVRNICEEIAMQNGAWIVFQNMNEQNTILLSGASPGELYDKAEEIADAILKAVKQFLQLSVSAGIGIPRSSLDEVHASYRGALSALDYRCLIEGNRIIRIEDLERRTNRSAIKAQQYGKEIAKALKTGAAADIHVQLDRFFHDLKESHRSINECYIQIQHILLMMENALDEIGHFEGSDQNHVVLELYEQKTLSDTKLWMENLSEAYVGHIARQRDDYGKSFSNRAKEFIQANAHDPGLSLPMVCKHLNVSASYFCLQFKNHTGMTFTEHLTQVRLNKARELLWQTTLKTYEIADRVGYKDSHYFSLMFRKTTGETPTEFRERRSREPDA